jgi:hypothetical protein
MEYPPFGHDRRLGAGPFLKYTGGFPQHTARVIDQRTHATAAFHGSSDVQSTRPKQPAYELNVTQEPPSSPEPLFTRGLRQRCITRTGPGSDVEYVYIYR